MWSGGFFGRSFLGHLLRGRDDGKSIISILLLPRDGFASCADLLRISKELFKHLFNSSLNKRTNSALWKHHIMNVWFRSGAGVRQIGQLVSSDKKTTVCWLGFHTETTKLRQDQHGFRRRPMNKLYILFHVTSACIACYIHVIMFITCI